MIARQWDEFLLRNEPLMASYWRWRNLCIMDRAQGALVNNHTEVMAKIHFDSGRPDIRSHLILRTSDLLLFAQGGGSKEVSLDPEDKASDLELSVLESQTLAVYALSLLPHTHTNAYTAHTTQHTDTNKRAHTHIASPLASLGLDSGTWPADGGGVASCRRDLIDHVHGIAWHQQSEIGNPMKLFLYATELHVHSLSLIPLWYARTHTHTHPTRIHTQTHTMLVRVSDPLGLTASFQGPRP